MARGAIPSRPTLSQRLVTHVVGLLLVGGSVAVGFGVLHLRRPKAISVGPGRVHWLAPLPDNESFLALLETNNRTRLGRWSFDGGRWPVWITLPRSWPRSQAASADGRLVLLGDTDAALDLLDAGTGKQRWTRKGKLFSLCAVALSEDGKTAAAAYLAGLELYDTQTGERTRAIGWSLRPRAVAFSPDGRRLAVGCEDRTIRLWDLRTGQHLRTFEGHCGTVSRLTFRADGRELLGADEHGSVRLWDVATGRCARCWDRPTGGNVPAALSPEGARFLDPRGGDLRIWDLDRDEPVATLPVDPQWQPSRAQSVFSPDGRFLFLVSRDGTIRRWRWP